MLPLLCALGTAALDPPTVTVSHDNTSITSSCRVVIAPGAVVADADGNGVIHIDADDVTVEFAPGTELRGAAPGAPWDGLTGVGVRVDHHRNVTLRGLRVRGYKVGVYASGAPGLVVDGAELSDNYRQHLRSTPEAEDGADWLYPHHNDANEWLRYGAALYVEDSDNVSISGVRVRRGQNGVLLDRVNHSRVLDNDCSFLTGWGVALWRSSDNVVSRNALDFCVRGYSHGVYNRGQDSAGILCFEQCSRNVLAENSVTHGGDGFFGFAGSEAIGESPKPTPDFDYATAGCDQNLLISNDFSDAVAHGIEMTFSHGNRFIANRLTGCGICGVWGGYSTGTLIAGNTVERNGEMAYGLERGGVNIEHGSRNRILDNSFAGNACAVHLWWDDDGDLLKRPGVVAGGSDVVENVIARNRFHGDAIAVQLRDSGQGHLRDNLVVANVFEGVGKEIESPRGAEPLTQGDAPEFSAPPYDAPGTARPVGARSALAGRANIVMDEWGPWDHESPMVRARGVSGGAVTFEVYGLPAWEGVTEGRGTYSISQAGGGRDFSLAVTTDPAGHIEVVPGNPGTVTLSGGPGVWSYDARAVIGDEPARRWAGTVVPATWDVRAFPWTQATDPRTALDAWRALADGPDAVHCRLPALEFRFGRGGPRSQKWSEEMARRGPGADYFGIRAAAKITFPEGDWRVGTLSDDGVRVIVNGREVLADWSHHGPTRDSGLFESDGKESAVEVEYFEIDGNAVLVVEFEPARGAPASPPARDER